MFTESQEGERASTEQKGPHTCPEQLYNVQQALRFMDEWGQESGLMKPSRKGSGAVSAQQGQEAPGSLPCGPLGAFVTKAHKLKSLPALTLGQSNQILLMTLRKLKVPLRSGKEQAAF